MMLAQQLYEGIDLKRQGTVGLITYMRTDLHVYHKPLKTKETIY